MSTYDRVNGQPDREALQQIKADPISMARNANYSVPDGLANDPRAIFQHLMQTGQIQGPKLNQARMLMQRLGLK